MHTRLSLICAGLSLMGAAACSQDWNVGQGEGDASDVEALDAAADAGESSRDAATVDASSHADAVVGQDGMMPSDAANVADAEMADGAASVDAANQDGSTLSACQLAKSCALGESCTAEGQCATGGVCDLGRKLCLADCGPVKIVTRGDLETNKFCRKVVGDFELAATFNDIDATALPYLEEVTGDFIGNSTALTTVTLSALKRIGKYFLPKAALSSAQLLSMPSLETIGDASTTSIHWGFGWPYSLDLPNLRTVNGTASTSFALSMTTMRLPKLQTVTGAFAIVAPKLTILDISALRTVGESISLSNLVRLPWSSLEGAINNVTTPSKQISAIGCCTASSYMCTSGTNYGC